MWRKPHKICVLNFLWSRNEVCSPSKVCYAKVQTLTTSPMWSREFDSTLPDQSGWMESALQRPSDSTHSGSDSLAIFEAGIIAEHCVESKVEKLSSSSIVVEERP